MAQLVSPGEYYYQIDDATHSFILAQITNDPGNPVWQDLLDAFDYQSPYVEGMWYAPTGMIDTDLEIDWAEENEVSFVTYWFRQSLQPGGHS